MSEKLTKCPNFTRFLPEKLSKYPNFHDICPPKLTKLLINEFYTIFPESARILHKNCPKIFSRILGGTCPPSPTPMQQLRLSRPTRYHSAELPPHDLSVTFNCINLHLNLLQIFTCLPPIEACERLSHEMST